MKLNKNMNLYRYEIVGNHEVRKELENKLQLTDYQKGVIDMVIDDLPFRFVKMETYNKSNPFFRLTLPLFFITWLVIFCSMPFKYLVTGDCFYSYEGKVIKLLESWKKKLDL